jgi:hypothetical protein
MINERDNFVDKHRPLEKTSDDTLFRIIRIYLLQMIYPFKVVWNKTLQRYY